jgi:hypothetical protein
MKVSGIEKQKVILVLAADPQGSARLRLDEEIREIDEGLLRSRNRHCFRLQQHLATRYRDLRRALLDYEPNIVHFSGHGAIDGIVLENDIGDSFIVGAEAIQGLFELVCDKVECVVLNSCYSERQAEAISQCIPFVLGMRASINDRAALEFSIGFYDALGAGRSYVDAFRFGKNAIQLANLPQADVPVIHITDFQTQNRDQRGTRDFVFKFRAECEIDVERLRRVLGNKVLRVVKTVEAPFPDTVVELHANLSLEELRNAMRQVEDGHVMVQTVAPAEKYTGERNFEL